jgi:hypothetical protein
LFGFSCLFYHYSWNKTNHPVSIQISSEFLVNCPFSERPFSERPISERPFSERPFSERPILGTAQMRPFSECDHFSNDHSPNAIQCILGSVPVFHKAITSVTSARINKDPTLWPDPDSKPKPDPKLWPDPDSKPKPDPKLRPDSDSKPKPDPKLWPYPKLRLYPYTKPGPDPKPKFMPDPGSKLWPDPDRKLWLGPDRKLWPYPDPEQMLIRNAGPKKKSV